MIKQALIFFMAFGCGAAFSQHITDTTHHTVRPARVRICVPSKGSVIATPPLMIVHINQRSFMALADSAHLNMIRPMWIERVNVLHDSTVVKRYGRAARKGVIDITLKDGNKQAYNIITDLLRQQRITEVRQ